MKKVTLKFKTSIMFVFIFMAVLIASMNIYFQYKSAKSFALLSTQKDVEKIVLNITNEINSIDTSSVTFLNLSKQIQGIGTHPKVDKGHPLYPFITEFINKFNYVYGIYLGYGDDSFYIVYNLNLSDQMKIAQNAPKDSRWLVKKHLKENGKVIAYKTFLNSSGIVIKSVSEQTDYKSSLRPWYIAAIKSTEIVKTKPYIFSSIKEPGITYANLIDNEKGVVLSLDITLNSFNTLLSKQSLVKGSAAFITDKDGKVIASLNDITKNKIENITQLHNEVLTDTGKQTIISMDEVEYIKSVTKLKSNLGSDEYLCILTPLEATMEPYIQKIYEKLLLTVIILTMLIVPLVIFGVKIITAPIVKLISENKKVAKGKFVEVKPVETFIEEIQMLSTSLVEMSTEVDDLANHLETKIEQRTNELKIEKENVEQILSNILMPMLITSKKRRVILYANKFAEDLYESTSKSMLESPIDDVYTLKDGNQQIIEQLQKYGKVYGMEVQVVTKNAKEFIGLLSVVPVIYNDEECFIGMTVDITEQKNMENQIRALHKHTRESIEYAAMIQNAVLPNESSLQKYFQDSFVHWTPKDTVGGDIWLFSDLRHDGECLIFCIDCTGHGVPGAFVTMIVKSIEREVISKICEDQNMDVSPAWIMGYFNKTMKLLLKQTSVESKSNAGWDGGIIYYNKNEKVLKFAGAETPLFYIDNDGKFHTVKGNRYSVGYKKCDMEYKYKETIIEVQEGMSFYCTTDGYLDQNGGQKDFPFGKKRFENIIKDNYKKPMNHQNIIFQKEMLKYESMVQDNERNDDMTLIGFKI